MNFFVKEFLCIGVNSIRILYESLINIVLITNQNMEEQTNPVLELPYSYNVNITNENDWIEEDDDSSSHSNYDENEIYEVEIHPEELDELMQELKEIKGLSTGKLLTIRNEWILKSEKEFQDFELNVWYFILYFMN